MDSTDTTRLKLTVHYDGSAFHGWQYQPDQRTVQGELEATLGRLAASKRVAVGSGRTDTGVHATGQVVSVDMPSRWSADRLRRALNATLPDDIWIERVEVAAGRFHPRFDATERTYRYDVGTAPVAASPFHRRWCWVMTDPLEPERLHEAASDVHGTHSFESFSKSGQPERGTLCTVHRAVWLPWELGWRFEITANRYLHHMVRYLVGTMVDIARGKRPPDDMKALLAGSAGLLTSPPAPPEGLFLTRVEYPSGSTLAAPENSGSDIPA